MLDAYVGRERERLLPIARQHLDQLEKAVSVLSRSDLVDPASSRAT
jgi:hypothetical protein